MLATRPPAAVVEVQSPLVGKQAPTIHGTTADGSTFVLPRQTGNFVVVNFFASWCPPCQTEGPELVKFAFQHSQSGDARMISVIFEDTTPAARSYQATLGTTWPTLADPGLLPAAAPEASAPVMIMIGFGFLALAGWKSRLRTI